MPAPREILVTHALPYANGPLHIGHLLGYIQSDIWVRARRMAGDTIHFVAADDVHGTPIMLAAEKAGMSAEDFIRGMQVSHEADFRDFGVAHDYYYTTHSPENRELAELVYRRLRDAEPSHIATRFVRQFYDPLKQMFLPDRYIKGECPNCGTADQYGDNCENCGATYAPTDLKNPRSVVSGATPELRDSEHYFFRVGDFTGMLRDWLAGKLTGGEPVAHPSVAAKLKEWLEAEGGVRDWDISRDAPYFGFPIPDAPGKFFYVWLDAPIGYLASFKKYCASDAGKAKGLTPEYFDEFMQVRRDSPVAPHPSSLAREMHHFLGKDIVNFHGLFWPAMLEGASLRTPTKLYVNGYLTVNGAKMSKSRGTFIQARTYLDSGLNPEYLRYYFASMLGPAATDIDLDLKAFEDRVNSHLVGKWVNIASRTAGFIHGHFDGKLAELGTDFEAQYRREVVSTLAAVRASYVGYPRTTEIADRKLTPSGSGCEFALATTSIMALADRANEMIAKSQPWKLAKQTDNASIEQLHQVCSLAINYFRAISILLAPIVPSASARAAAFLGELISDWTFETAATPLTSHAIKPFESLLSRIDPKQIESMIESSKESMQPSDVAAPSPSPQPLPHQGGGAKAAASLSVSKTEGTAKAASAGLPTSPLVGEVAARSAAGEGVLSGTRPAAPQPASAAASPQPSALSPAFISIEDFAKLDLRVGKVLQCEFVDGSDKLLRFELDAGELGRRQIFSGIRSAYQEPGKLVGRHVVFIANLAPRKMRFGVSEGMILSAGDDSGLFLLDADAGAQPGMPVK